MSMALWAGYQLDEETVIFDESDKYLLLEYMEELDELCQSMGLTLISDMLDYSEIPSDDDDFDEDIDEESPHYRLPADPQEFQIEPREALYTFDELITLLSENEDVLSATPQNIATLQEELQECMAAAQEALEQNGHFRLALVE